MSGVGDTAGSPGSSQGPPVVGSHGCEATRIKPAVCFPDKASWRSTNTDQGERNEPILLGKHWNQWHPTPVLLPGKSHGLRSLVGCSPWGHEESDMTEQLHFHFSFSCIGDGNGNPLQCSCLENPRDGGAWWAALYGVAQSRTRLK